MNWFRKNQGFLSTASVAIFIGAWLSLTCLNCIAGMMDNSVGKIEQEKQHCQHQTDIELDMKSAPASDSHCMGACDCFEIATLSNSKPISLDKLTSVSQQSDNDLLGSFTFVSYSDSDKQAYQCPLAPERAILTPLQYTCVLVN